MTRTHEFTVKRRRDFDALPKVAPIEFVTVDKFTECHVTPPNVAARMVDYLGPPSDELTLEPSAGTGNLSRALIASGYNPSQLVQVERHIKLSGLLGQFGTVLNRCFLEYAAESVGKVQFGKILMNPPFSDVLKHVAAALSLKGDGSQCCLVALVPVTFKHDRAEELEFLPSDTFSTAKVHTKIIRI